MRAAKVLVRLPERTAGSIEPQYVALPSKHPPARQQNAIQTAFCWRADSGPRLYAGLENCRIKNPCACLAWWALEYALHDKS